MVHLFIHPKSWKFIVGDPVPELTDSQSLGIQRQVQGLSFYCISLRLFYSRFLESGTRQSEMLVMVAFLSL